jgi:PAS domain S-box-containing protein
MSSAFAAHHLELSIFLIAIALLTAVLYYSYREIITLRINCDKTLESLKEQQELFDLLMEFSPIYIFFKDENIRPIKLSKNFKEMLGMPSSEAIGKTMDELFPSDFAKKMIQDDIRILKEELPVKLVEQLNGRTYITLKFPIKRADKTRLMAGFTIDITDQKKIETDLMIAKQQAEAANEAKDIFLANMSHELRTPMNGIMGFASLMATSGLNEKQAEYNEMIKESANHLLELINDVLDFSRLESKKLKLECAPLDLVQTAKGAIDMIIQLAEKKKLDLGLELKSEIGYRMVGDRIRIKQIIINLLSNAVKFTSSGSVTLSLEEKERSGTRSVIAIKVSDTGIGIPPESLGKIFEMFIQLDDSASKKHGGAGLGLSIVKGLVEAMGGKVSAESEVNKGSVFTVEIPFDIYLEPAAIKDPAPAAASNSIQAGNFKRPLNVLLVEDDVINQKFMKALLTRIGWKIQTASNGREAVELYEPGRFDALIMDGQMPEMSGFEASMAIREIEKTRGTGRVPIIALTAYAMKGDRDKFISAGMDDYISKPVQNEKILIEILRKYISD